MGNLTPLARFGGITPGRAVVAVVYGVLAAACALQQTAPTAGSTTTAGTLAGSRWRLVEFQSSDDRIGTIRPDNPASYTMTLESGGRVAMQINCNRGTGTWSATPGWGDSGSFALGALATTKVLCPPPSMDTQIARDAEYIRSYVLRNNRLYLNLMADGGTYVWEPAEGSR